MDTVKEKVMDLFKKNFNKDISKTNFKLINKNKNFPSVRGLFYDFSENTYKNEYIFLLNETDKEKIISH